MSRRLKQGAVVFVVALAAAQLIRPERANPPIDASRSLEAHVDAATGLAPIVTRSCGNCHSNATVWPRYSEIAPLSWVVARAVTEGRRAVNFSEWMSYPPDARRQLLTASCEDARNGRMPGLYALLDHDARLSDSDINTICAAAR